ncbi:MAG: outer membrane protein assembly factor [Rhodospirillales bacterium]|nr:outer membrane protein assembly factor [Rhodospirillales bacterium]
MPRPHALLRHSRLWLLALLALLTVPARAADPQPYTARISPTGIAALDQALHDASSLIALGPHVPVGAFALIARARADRARLAQVADGFGYYAATIAIRIDGLALADPTLAEALHAAPAAPPVPVVITVTPGVRFHLGHVGVSGSLPPGIALALAPGAPAIAARVLAAGTALRNALLDAGYALAKVSAPDAVLRPAAHALDIRFTVDAGPRVDLGAITITGTRAMDAGFVRRWLRLHPGERFDPRTLDAARARLDKLGVFASIRMEPASALGADGRLPLRVVVSERKRHSVELGADYSTDLGAGLSATWIDRNLFGHAENLALGANFNAGGTAEPQPSYTVTARFTKPGFLRQDQSLIASLGAVQENLDAYSQTALRERLGLRRALAPGLSLSVSLAAEQERVTQEDIARRYDLFSLPVRLRWDTTNNPLDPTRGFRLTALAAPTHSFGPGDATFTVAQISGSTYLDASPVFREAPGRSVLAMRALLGQIIGAGAFDLPPDQRFYAGGGGTVRGFKYQSIGPVFADGKPQGGSATAIGALEWRQRIGAQYGVAAFVDAGQVGDGALLASGHWQVGAGIGLRYYTAIGPIRLDVAVPVTNQPGSGAFQLYIGIGQAF